MENTEKLIVGAVINMLDSTLGTMKPMEADAIVAKASKILESLID